MRIARVFPTRTSMSPTDEDAYFGPPQMFMPNYDEVHVSCVFTWDVPKAKELKYQWEQVCKVVKLGGPAFDDAGGEFVPGIYLKPGVTITSRGCSNKCKFCFINGTKILTSVGVKNIEDINIGDMVLDKNGNFNKVVNTIKRHYAGDGIMFTTGFDNTPIYVTADHKFPTRTGDISIKDSREKLLQIAPIIMKTDRLPIANYIKSKGFIRNPIDSAELFGIRLEYFCELAGWYLAEGSISKSNKRPNSFCLVFSLSHKEIEDVNRIKYLIKEIFGIDARIVTRASTITVEVVNKQLGLLFMSLFGKGAGGKYISCDILQLKEKFIKKLICSYFRGDGSLVKLKEKTGRFRIVSSSASYSLSLSIALLLRSLGYNAIVRSRKVKDTYINSRLVRPNYLAYQVMVIKIEDVQELAMFFWGKDIPYKRKSGFSYNQKLEMVSSINLSKHKKIEDRSKENGVPFQTYYKWKKQIDNNYINEKGINETVVRNISKINLNCDVFNLTVEDSHTYTVSGISTNNCFVPPREGKIRELEIKPGYIVQDNNLLACSQGHIEKVFAMLKKQKEPANFSGGFEAARVNDLVVEQLRGLRIHQIWLAYDRPNAEAPLLKAMEKLKPYFRREQLRCYVLIGFEQDTLENAEYRLRRAWEAGTLPFAMLYEPKVHTQEWYLLQRRWTRPAITKFINTPKKTVEEERWW
ncbi:MAG: LAGLIDADG family homing endonuclease [Candidatus Izemoplasmatales bacterium]